MPTTPNTLPLRPKTSAPFLRALGCSSGTPLVVTPYLAQYILDPTLATMLLGTIY